jgi:hypothetical protein
MPLSQAVKDEVWRSALAHARVEGGEFNAVEVLRKIAPKWLPNADPSDSMAALNVIRSAYKSYTSARSLNPDEPTVKHSRPPIDPTLSGSTADYRYRTVVVVTGSDAVGEWSTAVNVDSPVPLDYREIAEQARAAFGQGRLPLETNPSRANFPGQMVIEVIVLTEGRRI